MKWVMRKCSKCGRYTLHRDKCPECGSPLRVPHPPRFSPEDKYLRYRLEMKVKAGLVRLDRRSPFELGS